MRTVIEKFKHCVIMNKSINVSNKNIVYSPGWETALLEVTLTYEGNIITVEGEEICYTINCELITPSLKVKDIHESSIVKKKKYWLFGKKIKKIKSGWVMLKKFKRFKMKTNEFTVVYRE